MAKKSGLKIDRKYTTSGNPYNNITWEKRSSKITNPDGSVVFEMNDVEIPSTWSQVATDIMVSKYFRKAGVTRDRRLANVTNRVQITVDNIAVSYTHLTLPTKDSV